LLIRNAYLIRVAILENHNRTNVSTQITRFNPKLPLELKHIFVLLLSRLYAFTTMRSGLRQVTKTDKMPIKK